MEKEEAAEQEKKMLVFRGVLLTHEKGFQVCRGVFCKERCPVSDERRQEKKGKAAT